MSKFSLPMESFLERRERLKNMPAENYSPVHESMTGACKDVQFYWLISHPTASVSDIHAGQRPVFIDCLRWRGVNGRQ